MFYNIGILSVLIGLLSPHVAVFGLRSRNSSVLLFNMALMLVIVIVAGYIVSLDLNFWAFESLATMMRFEISSSFLLDMLAECFIVLIALITLSVMVFAIQYLEIESDFVKFVGYISLFSLSMILFVSSGNMLQLFIGWEGVGIMSFVLVNYWLRRLNANRAALKAVFYNRVGDLGLFLGLLVLIIYSGTIDIMCINQLVVENCILMVDVVLVGLLIAAIAKSAQYGFHSWLLEAMEGPTPVSALLHSATMVTAGIFLNMRFSSHISINDWMLQAMLFVGLLTMCFGSLAAVFKRDIKKLTAFSSVSQLGVLMIGNAGNNFSSSFLHLETHALFKSLLFIIMGLILMQLSLHEQDSRVIGSVNRYNSFVSVLSITSLGALMGFPFFAGFYSKELIIQGLIMQDRVFSVFFFVTIFASLLTIIYSLSFLFLEFLSARSNRYGARVNTVVVSISLPLMCILFILSIGSIVSGYVLEEFVFNLSDLFISSVLFIDIQFEKLVVIFIILFSLSTLWLLLYSVNSVVVISFKHSIIKRCESLIGNEFYLLIWKRIITLSFLEWSYVYVTKVVDRGFLERVGALGLINIVWLSEFIIRSMQGGNLRFYSLYLIPLISFIGGALIEEMWVLSLLIISAVFVFAFFYFIYLNIGKKHVNE